MTDLFISYARVDRGRIEILATLLERAGWSVWWDRQIIAGDAFDKVIEQALQGARCVIVAWSARSVGSDWVRAEASFALEQNKLVPIALDHSPPPIRFINTHTLDLSDWDGTPDHMACSRLITDLEDLIGKPGNPITNPTRVARPDARADFHMPAGARVTGAGAVAVGSGLGPAVVAAPSYGTRLGLGAAGLLAVLVGLHVAYPRPLLAAFGANTAAIQADVAHRLLPLRCATVTAAVSQDWLFRVNVHLSGIVSVDDDIATASSLARTGKVSAVSSALTVVPWPFCDVVNIVETVAPPVVGATPPRIEADNADMSFKDGDRLVFKITAASIDGYLYVDYIDEDGNVAHMVPNPRHTDNAVRAGQEVTVGARKGETTPTEQAYEVSAPFGKRMILAATSRQPLFAQPRNQVETAASYLDALRAALAKLRKEDDGSAMASYRFITTEAGKP